MSGQTSYSKSRNLMRWVSAHTRIKIKTISKTVIVQDVINIIDRPPFLTKKQQEGLF